MRTSRSSTQGIIFSPYSGGARPYPVISIEVEEWVDLESHEQNSYRLAVLSRNLMAMRQAVTVAASDTQSSKMRRLEELLSDYRQSGEKVIVFSFFHSVLEGIEKNFDTVGRIDGTISSEARLSLIEKLRDVQGHALLLSQIDAGGVGLNIQAASVVILMEPQWKVRLMTLDMTPK